MQLQEIYRSCSQFVFVMERCELSLWQYITQHEKVEEADCSKMLADMLRGLDFVHSCDVVHRDVKPDNFLLQRGSVKLADFGLAAFVPPSSAGLQEVVGTIPFMSPEMANERMYGKGTDVWSLGAMAHALLCGSFPHMPRILTAKVMKKAIREGVPRPSFGISDAKEPHLSLSSEAEGFLRAMLVRQVKERPNAASASKLEFIAQPELLPKRNVKKQLQQACAIGAFQTDNLSEGAEC